MPHAVRLDVYIILSTEYDVNTLNQHVGEAMKTKEAVKHFGGIKQLADVLDIWPHNISRWGDTVPIARQYELEVKSGGRLKVNDANQLK